MKPKTTFVQFVKNALAHREMILALALRDMQSRYTGTLGGGIWAFAHPIAISCVFYFVFAIGFRAQGPAEAPFILWFICGLAPWFYFNDSLQAITNAITANAHLVKKTTFPTEVLPLVHVLSNALPHSIFMCILAAMLIMFDVPLAPERILVLYYFVCMVILLLGLGWLLSALQVFYRDIGHALSVILNILFWATPIVWFKDIIPPEFRDFFFLNPFFYIAEGYRGLLIYNTLIWPSIKETTTFWLFALAMLALGTYVFRRLKPEFPDVI